MINLTLLPELFFFPFLLQRCRAIYELAVSQSALDMPEMLWKNYIDFEIDEGEGEKARALYERLLEKTGHVKVWISYAQFEGTEVGKGVDAARLTFKRAHDQMKDAGMKEERVLVLDAWRVFEKIKGDAQSLAKVDAMLPRRVKRKRMRTDESGAELGWEEYFGEKFNGITLLFGSLSGPLSLTRLTLICIQQTITSRMTRTRMLGILRYWRWQPNGNRHSKLRKIVRHQRTKTVMMTRLLQKEGKVPHPNFVFEVSAASTEKLLAQFSANCISGSRVYACVIRSLFCHINGWSYSWILFPSV